MPLEPTDKSPRQAKTGTMVTPDARAAALLTRIQVASILVTSYASVVRLEEAGSLTPIVDDRGVVRYSPDEVEQVAASRPMPARQAEPPPPPPDAAQAPAQMIIAFMAQTMKHNEMLSDRLIKSNDNLVELATKSIDRMHDTNAAKDVMIDKLVQEKFATLDVVESLHSRRAERDAAAAWEKERRDWMGEIMERTLLPLLPLVMGKLGNWMGMRGGAGMAARPGDFSTPMEAKAEGLFKSLSEEQFNRIMGALSDSQKSAIADIFLEMNERAEARKRDGKRNGPKTEAAQAEAEARNRAEADAAARANGASGAGAGTKL